MCPAYELHPSIQLNEIHHPASSIWRLSPPLHTIPLRLDNLYLVMECEESGIPWDLVVTFGRLLLEKTDGGWTGLYRLLLSNAQNDISISIVLSVIDGAGRVVGWK